MAGPVSKVRLGNVEVSAWLNKGEKGEFTTHSIQRSYKDKDGKWQNQTITGLRTADLPKLAEACRQAYAETYNKEGSEE